MTTPESTVALRELANQQLAQVPSPGQMLQAVIEKGVTADNVAAVGELVKLCEHMQDRDAERAFAVAFVALQSEMPKVVAKKAVPNNDGSTRYCYAPYEEIMEQVSPMLQKHGFTITFSMEYQDGRLLKSCTLQHIGGHKKTNVFTVRIGKGPPGSSDTQADGAASTYAKRGALCDALNIVIETDDDARSDGNGATITPEQAADLKRRLEDCGGREDLFLKFAGAAHYEAIPASKYGECDGQLRRKENTK